MTPEEWRQVEQWYHAAADRPPEQWRSRLAGIPEETRREVLSLLDNYRGSSVLDAPVMAVAARLVEEPTKTPLSAGSRLGPYEIEAPLGSGGMGQVFRARDTRLGRTVAIKVVNEEFSERFEREARAISALNHPHVCALYDVGPNYLVMELVEGETLAKRLERGKLPEAEVLRYGAQIADALAEAHSKGVVHRDLKPANVMLAKKGVKVLDFGIARSRGDEALTAGHAVIGSPAYMAPEQRAGKVLDARADIYALVVVLSEIATGKRGVREGYSSPLAHVVERCLAEDPDERWQSARDVKAELDWIGKSTPSSELPGVRRRWIWPVATVSLLAFGLAAGWYLGGGDPASGSPATTRLQINAPPGTDFRLDFQFQNGGGGVAISPDGRLLAFVAGSGASQSLYVRPLDSSVARRLPNTEGAGFPFWSPDSKTVAFIADRKLKRIDTSGGPATIVCDTPTGLGGTWGAAGVLFTPAYSSPLFLVPASGGTPIPVTALEPSKGEFSHRWPQFLPDGRRFLYFIRSPDVKVEGIYLGSLDRPEDRTLILATASSGLFRPGSRANSGHLLWPKESALVAQALDTSTGRLRGDLEVIGDSVSNGAALGLTGASVSSPGTVVYHAMPKILQEVNWLDRSGRVLGSLGQPALNGAIALSRDGRSVLVTRGDRPSNSNIWEIDAIRGVEKRITFHLASVPVWSPNGDRIACRVFRDGVYDLFTFPRSRSAEERLLSAAANYRAPFDWSSDGRFLLYTEDSNRGSQMWVLPMQGDRKPFPYVQATFLETSGQFSPDGKWIAYVSEESGRQEVYVQSFPAGSGKWAVSGKGGSYPRWRRDGSEIFYVAHDGTLTSVPVRRMPDALEFGNPRVLFRVDGVAQRFSYPYDVAPDGQRFLVLTRAEGGEQSSLTVLSHWRPNMASQ